LPTPRPFEHLLDGAVWDADLLRDQVRDYGVAGLGSTDAILVADDTQSIKKGSKSSEAAPLTTEVRAGLRCRVRSRWRLWLR